MAGYMGFGMQKWIYSRNPRRKLYKRDRIPAFTALDSYSRTFALKPSIGENKVVRGAITLFFILSLIVILVPITKMFTQYSNNHAKAVYKHQQIRNEKDFNFLVSSGKTRLSQNRVIGAYSEFKLAYAINSKDKALNDLILQTLTILCENNNKFCEELDAMLQQP
ncbi:hypothetical protein [Seonamhaeicola marinus]|uniref:Uncharacterized protein n=1 Tax=Seonamhaeicola marinus TaxID=1912246 RepID=A0A5D0HKG6_9FLAO|nr:hypothetical protein [Seonamhaeicola marinus]TYA71811.1 hypothetical protein FUA24_19870 [Seonamhaeicola marinus]